jgi:PKD repeat protein
MFSKIRSVGARKLTFGAGALLAFGLLLTASMFTFGKASAATCDSDAIIYCGFTSPSEFVTKVKGNSSGNGHNDLQAIYAYYGLSSAQYSNFASHAVAGTTYLDGRIVVNGKTVATDANSIGREASMEGANPFKQVIGSTTYYGNPNSRVYVSDAIPVYVLFNDQGQMQFAVMKSCGNPVSGNIVKTAASCNSLNETAVSGQLNTYDFTAKANTSGNATVTKYVYNFGDGTPAVTSTDGTKPVRHTYAKAGNFTASVTEYANVPGNSNLQLPAVSLCTKVIKVTLPFYNCVQLTGAILDKTKYSYSFTATANSGNGATFTSADFNYGDGTQQLGVKPATATTAAVSHTYAKAGSYNITATLHFTVLGKVVTASYNCTASVTPTTPPTPTCKPGVPVGSPECTPCQFDASVSSDSTQCLPPALPNTGAGDTIAIFAGVVAAAFLVYRQVLFGKHRAAFMAAQRGSSALPLGNPLSPDAPLAGTPLAPQAPTKRSFRRKRQL